ncbi:MAG: response regulator [Proteobacteria bacterium]|nr:response regulator [Pseudomonadota bacterium]
MRLLIVEDEPGDARLMQLAMQKNGYAVELHGASDGFEALRFLRREGRQFCQAPRPDMVLLDLKMPGLSGLEFLAEMKQDRHLRAIPVVVITTSALDADVLAAYQCGAAGFVPKPTDINEFVEAIRKLGEYWFRLVRLPENPE